MPMRFTALIFTAIAIVPYLTFDRAVHNGASPGAIVLLLAAVFGLGVPVAWVKLIVRCGGRKPGNQSHSGVPHKLW